MKAIVIASLLFFSLRAMSAEVSENKSAQVGSEKLKCGEARKAKVLPSDDKKSEDSKPAAKTKSV